MARCCELLTDLFDKYWEFLDWLSYYKFVNKYFVHSSYLFNLLAPCILYIGQAYRYSPRVHFLYI